MTSTNGAPPKAVDFPPKEIKKECDPIKPPFEDELRKFDKDKIEILNKTVSLNSIESRLTQQALL